MCDICDALGQVVTEDGRIVRVGPYKGPEAVVEAFAKSAGPGMPSHPVDCQCRPCWNVRLKRQGLGVIQPAAKRRASNRRKGKGHRRP